MSHPSDQQQPVQQEAANETLRHAFTHHDALHALNLTADLLDVLGEEPFRAQAYRSAARSLEERTNWEELVAAQFKGVPKVGAALAGALTEAAQQGEFGPLREASEQLPPGLLDMLTVRGLGPKKVRALWQAGIESLEALREALESGTVASIKGFGAKTAQTLLTAVDFTLQSQRQVRLDSALELSAELADYLQALLPDSRPTVSGEAARSLETASSVRVLLSATPNALADAGLNFTQSGPLLKLSHLQPTEKSMPDLLTGADLSKLDLQVVCAQPHTRGAQEVWFASSPKTQPQLQALAQAAGLQLDEHGLSQGGSPVHTPTQAEFWAALKLPQRPPEYLDSEHEGVWQQLPAAHELIQPQDILGFIHTHSTHSDGAASLEEMAKAVMQRGPACYLGIADHSQAAYYARGLDPQRLRAQIREVRELQRAGLNVLAGSEVDILSDGRLDFDDDLLSELDYVVASVHSHFTLSSAAQTERLVRAVSHPLVTVLGHPTGRVLLRRGGYNLDLEAVLEVCAEQGTVVELNASPYRLDIDWRVALQWRNRLKFAINTDAHSVAGLDVVRYGAMVARKAGLQKGDVVNTLSQQAFMEFVRQQRQARQHQ